MKRRFCCNFQLQKGTSSCQNIRFDKLKSRFTRDIPLPHEIKAQFNMAMNYDGMNGTDNMDSSESRKRPLDTESENGVTKRSNQGAG